MITTYTAYLTSNKRDSHIMREKALITNITDSEGNEFRDHSWIELSKAIAKIQPYGRKNKPIKIEFTAKVKDYKSIDHETYKVIVKKRLYQVRNIKII